MGWRLFVVGTIGLVASGCVSEFCYDYCEKKHTCMEPNLDVDSCEWSCEADIGTPSDDCQHALNEYGHCYSGRSCAQLNDESQDICSAHLIRLTEVCDDLPDFDYGHVATCIGEPWSCSLMSNASSCSNHLGCTYTGTCFGLTRDCADFVTASACEAQIGCLFLSDECIGTIAQCESVDILACETQQGCWANATCTGVPLDCDVITDSTGCENTPGCFWYD
jgi:hypothetical protein